MKSTASPRTRETACLIAGMFSAASSALCRHVRASQAGASHGTALAVLRREIQRGLNLCEDVERAVRRFVPFEPSAWQSAPFVPREASRDHVTSGYATRNWLWVVPD